eukprot:Amastigsp_a687263_4.p3 type:complete len:114 gc:universal Amastigsp_a687263_4:555-214(-)
MTLRHGRKTSWKPNSTARFRYESAVSRLSVARNTAIQRCRSDEMSNWSAITSSAITLSSVISHRGSSYMNCSTVGNTSTGSSKRRCTVLLSRSWKSARNDRSKNSEEYARTSL